MPRALRGAQGCEEGMEQANDDSQDAIQRLLNDAKRAELEEQYGMRFSRVGESIIPPEVEGEWLDHITEFERQLECAEDVPLRQFVGYPHAPALLDIPSSEIGVELERLLGHMGRHNVYVDFPNGVEAAEAYRFIVEELLDEEIADIRMPGMRKHFVYVGAQSGDEMDAPAEEQPK
jgi:hypothetical protein